MRKFDITIASLPDRENLVAEILYDGVQQAEISQETEALIIQLYPHPRQEYWKSSLMRKFSFGQGRASCGAKRIDSNPSLKEGRSLRAPFKRFPSENPNCR